MSKLSRFLALLTLLASVGVLDGEKLYIPPIYELRSDLKKQSEINSKLEVENCLPLVEAGLLESGWVELSDPNVRFQLAYNRWLKLYAEAYRLGMLDYQEVLAFNKMVDQFESLVKRIERERKVGR